MPTTAGPPSTTETLTARVAALESAGCEQSRLRMWLNKGDPIRWREPWGSIEHAALEDEGLTLVTDVRLDRVFLFNGLFYGVEGMRVGGTRRLKISPHLGYGAKGLPGVVPPNSVLIAEITILATRDLA